MTELLKGLNEGFFSKEEFCDMIQKEPELIKIAIDGLDMQPANIKFGCSKALIKLSENRPELLYPYFRDLLPFLHHKNQILRFGMIFILANLTYVDHDDKFSTIFDEYYDILKQGTLIPASNVVKASSTIIEARPELSDQVVSELLEIGNYEYETEECKNIIFGHTIETFYKSMDSINPKFHDTILRFVNNQMENTRSGTRNKAAKFMKKYGSMFIFY